jgi:hypothetical protein
LIAVNSAVLTIFRSKNLLAEYLHKITFKIVSFMKNEPKSVQAGYSKVVLLIARYIKASTAAAKNRRLRTLAIFDKF